MVRRELIAAAGGLLLSGCGRASKGGDASSKTDRGTQVQGDIEVLNGLLELERRSQAFYTNAKGELFTTLAAHESEHARRLERAVRELGGDPVAGQSGALSAGGLDHASKLENTTIAAYLDAIPKLADPKLRALAASIVAVEAEHLAVVQGKLGLEQALQSFVAGERQL